MSAPLMPLNRFSSARRAAARVAVAALVLSVLQAVPVSDQVEHASAKTDPSDVVGRASSPGEVDRPIRPSAPAGGGKREIVRKRPDLTSASMAVARQGKRVEVTGEARRHPVGVRERGRHGHRGALKRPGLMPSPSESRRMAPCRRRSIRR